MLRTSCYRWRKMEPSPRELYDNIIKTKIRDIFFGHHSIAILLNNGEEIWYNKEIAYSADARQMALNYHKNGHTLEETSKDLGAKISTRTRWKKQLSETGNLEKAPLERQPRKVHDDELREYMRESPFATL